MIEITLVILKILGITSVVGFLGIGTAFLGFLPEIVVKGVIDKSEQFNSESQLKIKNNGRLSAYNIRADSHDLNVKIGNFQMINCAVIDCGPPVAGKLSNGETTETTIRPGIEAHGNFDQFDYVLTLKYCAKLLLFKKNFSKKWKIELKNNPAGYFWNVTNM